jgi:hypothetical protein
MLLAHGPFPSLLMCITYRPMSDGHQGVHCLGEYLHREAHTQNVTGNCQFQLKNKGRSNDARHATNLQRVNWWG